MARRGHAYPQVDARAAGLIDIGVLACPAGASVAEGLALLRKRNGRVLVPPGRRGIVLLEDLTRAARLGLTGIRAADLERVVPVVTPAEGEIAIRRRLLGGAPAVLVVDRLRTIGAVGRSAAGAGAGASLAARLRSRVPADALDVLAEVGRLAEAAGAGAFAVGGIVRDALIDPAPEHPLRRDIDVVIEGDGIGVARRAAQRLGGTLTAHEAFGTASLEGLPAGRVDFATARGERYVAPGALPTVRPGAIRDDLARRDFGVNALAVELSSGVFGLLDPVGGREDIARRRLRVLHPLSFVEDPTRIFRAARYAERLGFALDRPSLRARALALRLAPYAALSPKRIAAEIERILEEATPGATLGRLGAGGAFRLLDRRFRFSRVAGGRVAALPDALAWMRARSVLATPLELAALAIVGDQAAAVGAAALRGLGFSGEPLARLLRAYESIPALVERLGGLPTAPPSARAAPSRGRSATDPAWARLRGGRGAGAGVDGDLAERVDLSLVGDGMEHQIVEPGVLIPS